jgi:hypothetical protein
VLWLPLCVFVFVCEFVCVMVCVFVFVCERRHGGAQLALYSNGAGAGGGLHQVASVTQLDRQGRKSRRITSGSPM